jgi:hypothetical protein
MLCKENKSTSEYDIFSNALKTVLSVPHSQLKEKLAEEKKRKKTKRSDASRVSRA